MSEFTSQVCKANSDLVNRIYPELVKSQASGANIIASPLSLSSVMAMVYLGAKEGSRDQIRAAMAFPEDEEVLLKGFGEVLSGLKANKDVTLTGANRLYVQNGFDLVGEFQEKAKTHFKAEAENVEFSESVAASDNINSWVEKQTNSKIQNLISPDALNALTRMVLVNAIYFKGNWADKFDPAETKKGTFHISPEKSIEVDMMHKTANFKATFNNNLSTHILQMPYKGESMSMYFFLTQKPEGFTNLEENIGSINLAELQLESAKHQVALPKFKMSSTFNLNDPLKALGAVDMFDMNKANFTGMSTKEQLHVSSVVQKAFVEVNEEGTEAAAATGAVMMTRMMPRVFPFICDRPFMFAIRDNSTGLVVFVGKVMDPTKE